VVTSSVKTVEKRTGGTSSTPLSAASSRTKNVTRGQIKRLQAACC